MKTTTRFILIALAMIFVNNLSYSQEKSNYKCLYRLNMVKDTVTKDLAREEVYVVQIGNKITKGFTYQKFYLDSLEKATPDLYRKMFNEALEASMAEMRKTGDVNNMKNNAFHYGSFTSDLYKNYKTGEILVKDNISTYNFIYKDELMPQQWEISDDTTTILGYSCQKATCSYRGREYEAWFTTEIPISEGPWKFYGLPGLITKLHDKQKYYSFELIGFQKIAEPILTKIGSDARKIDRKEFYSIQFGDQADEIANDLMKKVGLPTSSRKTKQYAPIELDYKD